MLSVNRAAVDVVHHTRCFTANLPRVQLGQKLGCAFSSNCLRSVGGMFA